jgi:decaprenyl-phosphate phosphoribosyltransferase
VSKSESFSAEGFDGAVISVTEYRAGGPGRVAPAGHVPGGAAAIAPATVAASDLRPRRRPMHALLVATRPRQWVKNLLVIAAPGAAGVLVHDGVPGRVALAFAAFCLLSAGTYVINDVRDAHEDRRHPRKRHRPVAARELEPQAALAAGLSLMLAGLLCCLLVRPLLVAVGAGYLALTFSYTAVLRRIAVLDVAAIAGGFVLRAIAGGVAAPVVLSRWFLLVVTFGAVFVAAGKRHAELLRADQSRGTTRLALAAYSTARLRAALAASSALAVVAYCTWAFESLAVHGVAWRPLTILPFVACLARYAALLRVGAGEAPEELVLGDRWLQLFAAAWIVVFALSVNAGH